MIEVLQAASLKGVEFWGSGKVNPPLVIAP